MGPLRVDILKIKVFTENRCVEANTLDNLLADLDERTYKNISVVWIDVQGYEGYVYMGSKRLVGAINLI